MVLAPAAAPALASPKSHAVAGKRAVGAVTPPSPSQWFGDYQAYAPDFGSGAEAMTLTNDGQGLLAGTSLSWYEDTAGDLVAETSSPQPPELCESSLTCYIDTVYSAPKTSAGFGSQSEPGGAVAYFVNGGSGQEIGTSTFWAVYSAQAPSITSGDHVTFAPGQMGSFEITTTGFSSTPSLSELGTMPDGLTFTDNGNGTATISGTAPSTQGIYNIDIIAESSTEATQGFIIGIGEADFISPSQVVVGEGHKLHFHVVATGTPKPTIQAYGFPSWVNLGGPGGAILSGLAPQGSVGSYPCVLTATYAQGFITESFTLDVLGFTSAAAVSFTDGEAGSFAITTAPSGLDPSIRSSRLPSGIVFTDNDNGTATVSGTTTAKPGTYNLQLTAKSGKVKIRQTLALTVSS
jgi:large repetitive protein